MAESEVARLKQHIDLTSEAAQLALYGSAEVAKHERITARMMQGVDRILQLVEEGKHEEAIELMNSDTWLLRHLEHVS